MRINLISQFINLLSTYRGSKELIWTGNSYFQGLNAFFKELEEKIIKYRIVSCFLDTEAKLNAILVKEKRLRMKHLTKINSKTVSDLVDLPIKHLVTSFFKGLELDVYEKQILNDYL
jgi:excinuclease ABC subunit A